MSRGRLYVVLLAALAVGIPLASAGTNDPLPVPTVDSGPQNPTRETTATFTFSDTSSDQAVTFQCQLNNADFTDCTSPTQLYTGLTIGSHTFRVKAILGPEEAVSDPYSWVIDTTPPPAPKITATPKANDATPAFGFRDAEAGVAFSCKLDSHSAAPCSSPKKYARQADGVHTFRVRARDDAGNESRSTSYTWTIDTVAPVVTITQTPPNPSPDSTAHFAFKATDATPVTFGCRLDGAAFSRCTSPTTYLSLVPAGHTFAVRGTDAAGNPSAAVSYGWTVADTVGPATVSRVRRNVAYGLLRLAWSRPPDPDFDHVQVFVSKGQKGAKARRQTLVYSGKATHYTKRRFDNGTYYRFTIVGYDVAGNTSRGVSVAVPPSILLRPQLGVTVHGPPRLVWAGVRGASFYNVQLYRAGRKILSAWPNAPRLALKRRWSYSGHSIRLKKGTYSWFVWPAFGSRATSRYGHVLGWSQFTVR